MKIISQKSWAKIAVACLIFIIAVYGLLLVESQNKGPGDSLRRTTYSASSGGYKALYLWLNQLGLSIKRLEQSLIYIPDEAKVLMISDPEYGFGTGELDALKKWVEDGGTLIFSGGILKNLWSHFGLRAEAAEKIRQPEKAEEKKIFFQPGPYTEGVGSITTNISYTIESDRPETVFPVSDETGGIIAVTQEGEGRIIAISDPGFLSNIYLKSEDNSRLALNLFLTHLDGGPYLY